MVSLMPTIKNEFTKSSRVNQVYTPSVLPPNQQTSVNQVHIAQTFKYLHKRMTGQIGRDTSDKCRHRPDGKGLYLRISALPLSPFVTIASADAESVGETLLELEDVIRQSSILLVASSSLRRFHGDPEQEQLFFAILCTLAAADKSPSFIRRPACL
ncbi:hypothetical protein ACLOJK_021658 [Asimina triloba]